LHLLAAEGIMTLHIQSISNFYSSTSSKNDPLDAASGSSFEEMLSNENDVSAYDEQELQEIDQPQMSVDESAEETSSSQSSAAEEFIKYINMSPIQRIRYDYLKSQGLDEESLSKLSPELRKAIEDEIKKLIEQKLHIDMSGAGDSSASAAAFSQTTDASLA
jgi:hypothetical protein